MRRICIVGAGQAGLHLAIGLAGHGYDVTVVSDRTGREIHDGRVMSSQCMFGTTLAYERRLGLDAWADTCPPIAGLAVAVPDPRRPGAKAIDFAARLPAPARSVDQRIKMPHWMTELTWRGGTVLVHEATVADLQRYTREYDLVIVAAGKGDIARLFERNPGRSPYATPQRALALTYVTGLAPRPDFPAVSFNLIPGVGEYFVLPALTTTGPCDIMIFEGQVGGPMDAWSDVASPEQHLERSIELLRRFLPWEAERAANVRLTDPNGTLAGRFAPVVRRPIGNLPDGGAVLGIGDAVVLNDPITGQGSGNAARFAEAYLRRIVEHGQRPLDRAFMAATFDAAWQAVQPATAWTNAMLGPPAPHVLELFGAASRDERVATRFVAGFDDPADLFDWFMDPLLAKQYLADLG